MRDCLELLDDAFPPSSPSAEGVDPGPLQACRAAIEAQGLAVHGLLIVRRGRRILELHGDDAGRPLGPDDLRLLHSTTKTFTGMLVGQAIAEGRLSLETCVAGLFSPGELALASPAAARIRIGDLLTMRSGLEYAEGTPRDWKALSAEPRPSATFLSRPMLAAPGQRWNYSSADSHLLAEALRRVTGRRLVDLAQERLFAPLGIRRREWNTDADGAELGGTGLWLRPRDLARFGWMLLSRGRWQGAEVVPAAWIDAATRVHVVADSGWTVGEGYGYQCWIPGLGGFATRGYQGQAMYAFPERELLVVFTGALVPEHADATLDDLVRTFVLPAMG
jgi:CubicO group peptidase (beta-lactamase class C family)